MITEPCGRLEALDRRAVAELEGASREVLAILDAQTAACAEPPGPDAETIGALRALRALVLDRCLVTPVESLERAAPIGRARAALDLHERTVRSWVRLLPETVPLSGKQAVALAALWGGRSPWAWVARWMDAPRTVPLRAIAAEVTARLEPERADAERACLAAMAVAMRQAGRRWSATRLALDATADWSVGPQAVEGASRRAASARARADTALEEALAQRRVWLSDRFLPVLGAALVRGVVRPGREAARPRPRPERDPTSRDLAEAVRAELELERGMEEATATLLSALDAAMSAETEDDAALDAELDRLVALLPRFLEESGEPRVEVDVTPAAARLAELDRVAAAEAERLPARVTLGGAAVSGHRGARTVRPARVLLDAYHDAIRPSCAALFGGIEA
ncbi:MAG: hypothetical protein KY466_14220, partial [Gemmatimonadetes bacterium]|nr:hypothetical protein [Gemmatimonadota bacterium]